MKYKVAGINPAYDTKPGGEVELDHSDPLVQLNVQAGVLEQVGTLGAMTCPACVAEEKKRPAKLADQAELNEHYAKTHPGLVPIEWKEEVE